MKRVDLIDAVPDAVVVAVVLVGDGAMIGNAADAASRGESARVTSHGGANGNDNDNNGDDDDGGDDAENNKPGVSRSILES